MKKIFLILLCSCAAINLLAQTWAELGKGSNALKANNSIKTIVVDHSGNVYAGGSFTNTAGYYIVSTWNGTSWNELGDESNLPTKGRTIEIGTNCLVIDSANNVYATYKGDGTPPMFLKWNGISWVYSGPQSSLGEYPPLAVDKNQHIYANRHMADYEAQVEYYGIDLGFGSSNWQLLGEVSLSTPATYFPYSFFMGFYGLPNAITIDLYGNVYVGGSFNRNIADSINSNSPSIQRVVKYNGTAWSTLEDGQEDLGIIQDLAADQLGNIYAASNSAAKKYVAIWNGTTWAELGTGSNALNANGNIWTLAVDKSGNVYAAGDFTNANGKRYVAKWDGDSWSELGTGADALSANDIIYDITTDAVGNVYAAGNFTNAHGERYVAAWSNGGTLGIQSRSSNQVVSFYPNPSNGFSQIDVVEDIELTVYSSLGEPLKTFYIHSGTSSIDLSFLTEGLYMLVCRGETDTTYAPIKFIKE